MTHESSSPPPTAALSDSLLARKGNATAHGFAGAPELVPPPGAPDANPPPAAGAVATTPAAAPSDAPRILIVEDNALNMKMMTDLFEGNGFRALSAVNGPQALMLARAERPDLIVMDIELPGLSGLEVTRRLKADSGLSAVPVIAVSARVRAEDAAVARQAGCDGYLAKPVSISRMLATVAGLLP